MLGRLLRRFGFLLVGILTVVGGGLMVIYGILLIYVSAPNANDPSDLQIIHDVVFWLLAQEPIYVVVFVGFGGFIWEVRRVGFLPRDDRLLYQIRRDKRRELAEKKEVWDKPQMDEENDPYEELYEDLHDESEKLTLARTRFNDGNTPSVSGLVLNKSNRKTYRDVVVEISFYDGEKSSVDTTVATTKELTPGDSWEFEVFPAPEVDDRVQYYKVTDIRAEEV